MFRIGHSQQLFTFFKTMRSECSGLSSNVMFSPNNFSSAAILSYPRPMERLNMIMKQNNINLRYSTMPRTLQKENNKFSLTNIIENRIPRESYFKKYKSHHRNLSTGVDTDSFTSSIEDRKDDRHEGSIENDQYVDKKNRAENEKKKMIAIKIAVPLFIKHCKNNNLKDAEECKKKLERHGFKLSIKLFGILINTYCKNGKIDEAVSVIENDMANQGATPDGFIYDSIIHGYALKGNVEKCEYYLTKLRENCQKETSMTLTYITQAYLVKCGADKALEFLRETIAQNGGPVEPSLVSVIVEYLQERKQYEYALKIIDQLDKEFTIKFDTLLYNQKIKSLCETKKIDDALKLLYQMKNPSHVTYNRILHYVIKSNGNSEIMTRILEQMSQRGIGCSPSTIQIIVNAFCRKEMHKEALEFMQNANHLGTEFITELLEKIINSYVKFRKVDEAINLVNISKSKYGISPTINQYNAVLRGLGKTGEMQKAIYLFQKIKSSPNLISTKTYNIMIEHYCENKLIDEAENLFNEMNEMGIKKDLFTFCSMIYGYSFNKEMDLAESIFNQMVNNEGISPTSKAFNILIRGYRNLGLHSHVNRILERMKEYGITPDHVTHFILSGHTKKNTSHEHSKHVEQNSIPPPSQANK